MLQSHDDDHIVCSDDDLKARDDNLKQKTVHRNRGRSDKRKRPNLAAARTVRLRNAAAAQDSTAASAANTPVGELVGKRQLRTKNDVDYCDTKSRSQVKDDA